jgi:hypothetical protein
MASLRYLALLCAGTAPAAATSGDDMLGPGAGPSTVASPDSVGLDEEMLRETEATVNARVGGRTCYVVVKDGNIMHETYRGSGGMDVISEGFSTKSQCSTLFGIAREQGWASPFDSIASRNSGTRQCNADAEFPHSLSMTGQSANLDSPTFSYDTLGTQCLDTISDFIDENNPDGLNAEEWKDPYWQRPLGLEHSRWVGDSGLACGTSSVVSCRDLTRTAALVWANNGQWPDQGQMVSAEHIHAGRRLGPEGEEARLISDDYGSTVWLCSCAYMHAMSRRSRGRERADSEPRRPRPRLRRPSETPKCCPLAQLKALYSLLGDDKNRQLSAHEMIGLFVSSLLSSWDRSMVSCMVSAKSS